MHWNCMRYGPKFGRNLIRSVITVVNHEYGYDIERKVEPFLPITYPRTKWGSITGMTERPAYGEELIVNLINDPRTCCLSDNWCLKTTVVLLQLKLFPTDIWWRTKVHGASRRFLPYGEMATSDFRETTRAFRKMGTLITIATIYCY